MTIFCRMFQDDAEFKKARGAELEYESLKVSGQTRASWLVKCRYYWLTPENNLIQSPPHSEHFRFSASRAGVGEQEAET